MKEADLLHKKSKVEPTRMHGCVSICIHIQPGLCTCTSVFVYTIGKQKARRTDRPVHASDSASHRSQP